MSFHPKTGDTYSVMSDVVWTERDTTQTLNLLRKAISMEPDNVGNYLFLATRFTQIGNADDSAIFYLQRLLQYDPEYGQAFMKLGNVYNWHEHKYDSATFYYRKAIENYYTVKPRDNRMMAGYYFLATVYANEKKYDSAIHYFNTFLQEMKSSDMYVRDQFLDSTYRALYKCYQNLAARCVALHSILDMSGMMLISLEQLWFELWLESHQNLLSKRSGTIVAWLLG